MPFFNHFNHPKQVLLALGFLEQEVVDILVVDRQVRIPVEVCSLVVVGIVDFHIPEAGHMELADMLVVHKEQADLPVLDRVLVVQLP